MTTAFLRRRHAGCAALLLLLLAGGTTPARGQAIVHALLPDSTAESLVAFFNNEFTTRLHGDARISPGTAVRGGVAVLGGTLTIEGAVDGDVVVINGDLDVRSGARIGGAAVVAGGEAHVAADAVIAGALVVHREPLRYRYQEGGIAYVPPEQEIGLAAGHDFPFGRTEMMIAARGAYSRAEGLPIAAGPRLRFGGSHPTTARALLIVRTAAPTRLNELDPKRIGYDVRAEQLIAPDLGITLGAGLYSEFTPIEDFGVSNRESALSTFVLHRDYRDHYEREGWTAFGRLARPGARYTVELRYRDEEHTSTPVASPITLLYHDDGWRPEVTVAEGALRTLAASLRYDTRNEERDPSAGWLIRIELEQGLGGSIVNRAAIVDSTLAQLRRPGTSFLSAHADVRRYARLSPYTRLGLRVVAAGSLTGAALPPQRQHALGGEGSLAGYRLFEFDCGARTAVVRMRDATWHPYYGCDQMALVQLEYQASFPFARRITEAIGLSSAIGQHVRWVAFFDAGRAWNEPDARDGREGGNDDFSADAGAGLRLGPLGIYWALPLSGRGQGFNFFVRLGARI